MKQLAGSLCVFALTIFLSLTFAYAQERNHSFDVYNVTVTDTMVTFTGSPMNKSALDRPMQARVCDGASTSIIFGQTHTFSTIDETFDYSVDVSAIGLTSGDFVIVSVTDTPIISGCTSGFEGFFAEFPLGFGVTQSVPALGGAGILLLILLVAVVTIQQRRVINH